MKENISFMQISNNLRVIGSGIFFKNLSKSSFSVMCILKTFKELEKKSDLLVTCLTAHQQWH